MPETEKVTIPESKPKVNPSVNKVEKDVQPVIEVQPNSQVTGIDSSNASDLIASVEEENINFEREQKEKRRLKAKINAAIKAAESTKTEQNKNIRTGQILSEKTYYINVRYETGETDDEGNLLIDEETGKPKVIEASIYDFMKDKEVTEILQFIVPKGDEENEFGDPISKTISFYWKNQQFI